MHTGLRWRSVGSAVLLIVAVLCLEGVNQAQVAVQPHSQPHQKKAARREPPPPLPSGPTGPVQQVPLDAIAAVAPQVSYQNNELTIVAPNSTLADILRAVRKQTGAEIDVPSAPERVVTRLGPGPARDVVAELLNGSRFNYVLLGSPSDDAQLTKVVLVAKSGAENMIANATPAANPQPNNAAPPPQQEPGAEAMSEPEQNDDNSLPDDAADQAAAEAEQQQQQQQQPFGVPQNNPNNPDNPDQPAIKTPQQMLQEMQQRQMQLQQQQVPGQPPMPGSGMPPHPPQQP